LPRIQNDNGRDKKLWVPRGIVIPGFKSGQVYRIRIRRPKPDIESKKTSKYYIVPGSGMAPMSIEPDQKALVVVESELDGMLVARRAGAISGVVALGSAATKPGADVYPYLRKALRVLVALDFDAAGLKAWKWWQKYFDNAKQWPVPEGKDPGEAYEKGIDIKEWVKSGLPPALVMPNVTGHKLPSNLQPPEGMYPIEELRFFLKRLPIEITATDDKAKINFSSGLKNQWIRNRVTKLFFEDDEVFYFFTHFHPDAVIHGGNCDYMPKIRPVITS